jgi:hypothetical protein
LGAQAGCCGFFNFKALQALGHPKIVYSGLAGALAGAAPALARALPLLIIIILLLLLPLMPAHLGLGLLVELPRRRTELSVYRTQHIQALTSPLPLC